MDLNNTTIQNTLEQNTPNMIFYEDSYAKTAFLTKEILKLGNSYILF